MDILLLVIAVLAAIFGAAAFGLAPVDAAGRTREPELVGLVAVLAAALIPLALVFLWALVVFSCHGGYECPI